MKISNKQLNDIDCIKYFIPSNYNYISITENDIQEFLELSDKGISKENRNDTKFAKIENGFTLLLHGKRLRGLHMRMWEESVRTGDIPYFTLLGGLEGIRKWWNINRYFKGKYYNIPLPRNVVDFIKKEMFKGIDSEIIEKVYQEIIK